MSVPWTFDRWNPDIRYAKWITKEFFQTAKFGRNWTGRSIHATHDSHAPPAGNIAVGDFSYGRSSKICPRLQVSVKLD